MSDAGSIILKHFYPHHRKGGDELRPAGIKEYLISIHTTAKVVTKELGISAENIIVFLSTPPQRW